ncbi:MAG: hypothetical protein NTZ20_00630 [Candidatus Levybacteria bacterium]|nr:hypothetical protein [Candidatus Levybacteria bacterium]
MNRILDFSNWLMTNYYPNPQDIPTDIIYALQKTSISKKYLKDRINVSRLLDDNILVLNFKSALDLFDSTSLKMYLNMYLNINNLLVNKDSLFRSIYENYLNNWN